MLHRLSSSLTSCVWRWKQAAQGENGGSPRAYAHSHFGEDAAKALQKFPLWVQLLSIKEEWRWLYLFQRNQATMRNKRTLSSWAVTLLNTAWSITTGAEEAVATSAPGLIVQFDVCALGSGSPSAGCSCLMLLQLSSRHCRHSARLLRSVYTEVELDPHLYVGMGPLQRILPCTLF